MTAIIFWIGVAAIVIGIVLIVWNMLKTFGKFGKSINSLANDDDFENFEAKIIDAQTSAFGGMKYHIAGVGLVALGSLTSIISGIIWLVQTFA